MTAFRVRHLLISAADYATWCVNHADSRRDFLPDSLHGYFA
jgi:hypothetical protein